MLYDMMFVQLVNQLFVDGYIVEGHVNYSAIKKMLQEKPDVLGISVPGMPIESPGM